MPLPPEAPGRRAVTAAAVVAALAATLVLLSWTARETGVEAPPASLQRAPDSVMRGPEAAEHTDTPAGSAARAAREQPAEARERSELPTEPPVMRDDGAADAAQIAAVKAAFKENLEAGYRTRFAGRLTDQGLAPEDAERVVGTALDQAVGCTVDTFVAAAEEQGVKLSALLDAIEATLAHADGPDIVALIDMQTVTPRLQACNLAAIQQAGMTLP